MVKEFSSPNVALVYADEDLISCSGRRHKPMFKPAWSPLLARSGWLSLDGSLIRLSAIPADIDLIVGSVNDIALSIAPSISEAVVHLPQVLLSKRRLQKKRYFRSVKPELLLRSPPKVSVIIPIRDRKDLLSSCIEGLRGRTTGVELEVIIVDNDSRDDETLKYLRALENESVARVVPMPGPFNFSRACNLGLEETQHELILLLNNDVYPVNSNWLEQMVQEMDEPSVGAVGAFLLYPDGLVQHAGVTLGAGSIARHSFSFIRPNSGEDRGLLAERRDVSAVTGACLLTSRSLWREVGGMDEEDLAVAFNDVDYCLKLRQVKKRVIWTPYAKLWHHESVSRGKDDTEEKLRRFSKEEAVMYRRWGKLLRNDPFHNPNLSKIAEDFVLEAFPEELTGRISSWR
jgi:GT2 family glycosyltransferase